MKKRKRFILHKTQLKTTMSVLRYIFLGVAIIVSIITFAVYQNNSKLAYILKKNATRIHRVDNIAAIQDNLIEDIMMHSEKIKDPIQKMALQDIAMDHYKNMATIKKSISDTIGNMKTIKFIMKSNTFLIIAIILVVLFQGIALFILGIRISHKFTGPLYIISHFLRDYVDGKNPELRELREGDELQEFYDLFEEAVDKVKKERLTFKKSTGANNEKK